MHPFRCVHFSERGFVANPTNNPIRSLRSNTVAIALLLACGVALNQSQAQQDLTFEPYTVFVAEESSHARCGPSGEYYRTDPLRHGQSLEVYAETDDGWLGIRPPDDSFCWIPAETVETESEDSAIVVEDRTVAWIGTHLGRARTYRWQVQLAKGESVGIVGKSEREGPDGEPQLWYRIVPPSGEYRWVHRDQVVETSEELIATIRKPSDGSDIEFMAAGPTRARNASTRLIENKNNRQEEPQPSAASLRRKQRSITSSGRSIVHEVAKDQPQPSNEVWKSAERTVAAQPAPRTMAPSDEVPTPVQAAPQSVTEAMQQGGLLASVEFLGRPKLLDIGEALAPNPTEQAGDGNWVSGARASVALQAPAPIPASVPNTAQGFPINPPNSIMQVAAQSPIGGSVAIATSALQRPVTPPRMAVIVPAQRIAQIQAEARIADVDQLSLILSRLMAARATAAEVDPVAIAARNLASSTIDTVMAGRARLLAERAEQYRRVASRRDGSAVIDGNPTIVPTLGIVPNANAQQGIPASASGTSVSGYLVQVYSARSNSPPFALTDNAGRTVAYVTPMAGMNLRTHLNSRVTISGDRGFLTGLNTPHILASQASRTPE